MKIKYKHIKLIFNIVLLTTALVASSCLTEEEQLETKYKPVTVTTNSPTSVSYNSITVGGRITAPQERNVQRGFCWSTIPNQNSEQSYSKTTGETGIGNFSTTITGLSAGTKYYIKAFARSSLSTVYGNEVSVTTSAAVLASVTTNIATTITTNSAVCGGNVTEDGGSSVTAKGVCWSTSTGPTILNTKTANGSGTGLFTSSLSSLSAGVTYYVRAYATNSKGTAYGNEISFKTLSSIPAVSTNSVISITATSASSGGDITSDGGASITSKGVCWSTSSTPTILNSKSNDGTGTGSFSSSLTGLSPNTTYYVRAYATNSAGTAYGSSQSFKTNAVSVPVISTNSISSITLNTAISGGNITSDGGASVTAKGVCWSNSTSSPTISYSKTSNGTGTGSFTSSITGLTPNTTYYVRAYATNSAGTAYGSVQSFRTNSVSVPTITTTTISSISTISAIGGGSISSDGGASITSKGVCWSSTTSTPTTSNSLTSDGTGTGAFSSSITGLSANTTYYVRAYATNSAGTAYGSVQSFRTNSVSLPVISTSTISTITTTSASGGGNVSSDGGASITSKGVCWSSSTSSPTTSNSKTIDGTGTGAFTSSITGLISNTVYYVRAYATNSAGTAYGNVQSFRTNSVSLPVISTNTISSVTATNAVGGGSISSDGGASISSYGVCWSSLTSSPITSDNKTIDGSGIGSFTSSISGLSPNTTYYVRAYATNSVGTAYGSVRSFTTSSIAIGQSYQGGIIFYVDGTGLHGLICATTNQSTGIRWYNGSYVTTGATASSVGYGNTNTSTIVSYQGTGSYAARLCYDLSLNGYSDWYLPSRSELNLMYSNLKSYGLGGFSSVDYWSSTEASSTSAYYQSFSTGTTTTATKSTTKYVRAVRSF